VKVDLRGGRHTALKFWARWRT